MFNLKDYDYYLPQELIAQTPAKERDKARLMILYKDKGRWEDTYFFNLPAYINKGDLVVVNNSRVIPSRLYGKKETGGKAEILILDQTGDTRTCLLKSSKRPKKGNILVFDDLIGEVKELLEDGKVKIKFRYDGDLDEYLEKKGYIPLPPYIKRKKDDPLYRIDKERYQTIFAKEKGSIAAPTAGLHFSSRLIKGIMDVGARITHVTLHVGYGTFKPVRTNDIRKHNIGKEYFMFPKKQQI